MKKLLSIVLIMSLLFTSIFAISANALEDDFESQTSETELSECKGKKTDAFLEEFSNSTNITIDIYSSNSKWMNGLNFDSIKISSKDDKLFISFNGKLTMCTIENDGEAIVYYPVCPFFYFREKSLVTPNSMNWYLRLMVFSRTTVFRNEFTCYNETINDIEYHVEECRVETSDYTAIKKYYFIDDEMVRMSFGQEGSPDSFEDYSIKVTYDEVDDSCFELPSTAIFDLTWLYKIFSLFYY
ncbi:MAG: hypothetical protein ACI4I3_03500 [Acutalibacteraceae bacterium]